MADFSKRITEYWQDSLTFLVGVWLFFSGWILSFSGIPAAFWTAIVLGAAIAIAALLALAAYQEWEEWVGMVLGVLVVIAPWVFGFAAFSSGADTTAGAVAATWNMIAVGVVTILLDAAGLSTHRSHEGHTT